MYIIIYVCCVEDPLPLSLFIYTFVVLRIHSRYKVDVARRLVPGALHVAYGQQDVQFQGPFPSGFSHDAAAHTVTITFSSGNAHLQIRSNNGFEVCVLQCVSISVNERERERERER